MRAEKELLLHEIREKFSGAKAILLTRYTGMTANTAGDFRTALRKTGGEFEVIAKRLLHKAAEIEGIDLRDFAKEGHQGVVVATDDALATTKVVIEFGKEHSEIIEVLGGQIDGTVYGPAEIKRISQLPNIEGMRAEVLGLFEAPMSQTLSVMEALLTSVMHCLENKRQKDEQA